MTSTAPFRKVFSYHLLQDLVMEHDLCSASRVLAIPELVMKIISSSTYHDMVQLAQVSRRLFETLVPRIWGTVHGVHNLLRLIESTSLQYHESSGRLAKVVRTP